MSKPYRLVVFDWEGTLGDTLGKIINILTVETQRMSLGEFSESLARQHLMMGLIVTIKKIFPHLSSVKQQQLLQAVQASLASRSMDVYLNPGAKAIVKKIQEAGMDLAIATNKGQHSLLRDLQASGLDAYFTVTRSASQAPAKPCPQMLEEIMEACNVTPSQTLMVGDSVSDVVMARAVNVDAVGVQFYHQPELAEELFAAGALNVFDDYQQLASYLNLDRLTSF
ncbi:HAD family hydrolase [Legionella nagasakiensis]|uniref:HAD family hydrolase n=1 Tax=Legionella nagasakiensis TaxID=535290 RepID=UPI0010548F7E|nr:HAD-IA family hydrolase [Legionella nagasakiensis]